MSIAKKNPKSLEGIIKPYFRLYVHEFKELAQGVRKNSAAIAVYIAICAFANYKTGKSWITKRGIAAFIGSKFHTVSPAIELLMARGFITQHYHGKRRYWRVRALLIPGRVAIQQPVLPQQPEAKETKTEYHIRESEDSVV